MQRWAVTVPACLGQGDKFMATLGSQKTIIKAPEGSVAGTKLEVQVPSRAQFFDVQVPSDAGLPRFPFHCGSIDALGRLLMCRYHLTQIPEFASPSNAGLSARSLRSSARLSTSLQLTVSVCSQSSVCG